jgi:hypothetical protein
LMTRMPRRSGTPWVQPRASRLEDKRHSLRLPLIFAEPCFFRSFQFDDATRGSRDIVALQFRGREERRDG